VGLIKHRLLKLQLTGREETSAKVKELKIPNKRKDPKIIKKIKI